MDLPPSAEDPKLFYVITWFGTVLCSDIKADFMLHKSLLCSDATVPYIMIYRTSSASGCEGHFFKRFTAPRALPEMRLASLHKNVVSMQCIKAPDSQAIAGSFISAIPDGTIEVNRSVVSLWENFVLLNKSQLDLIKDFLFRWKINQSNGELACIQMEPGFLLRSGQHRVDLHLLLSNTKKFTGEVGEEFEVDDLFGGKIAARRCKMRPKT